ncbi:MAG: amino acid ABC transporter permease, partial [Lachnospira sp.]|nr:amino acid ABC transporter permease [Lachnospira sp.]
MTVHTILQAVCLFIIYTVLTVVLPELVFHQKYKGRRTGERLMLDITVSNFYIMNLVFILQLLHISSIYTLLIFTVMPVFAVIIIQYRKAFKAWGIRQLALLGKISSKTMGIKTFFAIVFTRIKDILCNACKNIFHIIGRHKTEYVLFTLLSVWLLYIYGSNEILQYGYTVSDLPVHNYWINEMSKNNIFAAGVYPFGFHCIIYYIHTVFHIDTYVILRLFSVVQTFYLHLVLFTFIRCICRSSFAAYGGLFLYLVPSLYHGNCTIRFISALPQEYGMLFILPCIYFLFAFFKDMKENAGKWI